MPLYLPPCPLSVMPTGQYLFTASPNVTGTSATLGVGTLRVVPWVVHAPITMTRIGGEITSAGEAGSKLRLGIWADNGSCYPGSLILDAGTIAGDSATVQEITISQSLARGLYWVGAAVQVVSVTQPTVRIINANWTGPVNLGATTSQPASNANIAGFLQTSVTGAFGASFTATAASAASVARVFVKI